jgi:hypothetical protein
MPNTPLVGTQAVVVIPLLSGPAQSYLMANNDPSNNNIWLGTDSSVSPNGSNAFLLSPGGAITLSSTRTWWACTENDTNGNPLTTILTILPDGTSWAPAASQIAEIIAPLAEAIAVQIAETGIPLTANPQLIYDVTSPSSGGGGGGGALFGVSIVADSSGIEADLRAWQTDVGRPVTSMKIYDSELRTGSQGNNWKTTVTPSVQACMDMKIRACLCYSPPFNPPTATAKANMAASFAALKALLVGAGAPAPVACYWQEPTVARNNLTASLFIGLSQYYANTDANGTGIRSMGQLFYDMQGFHPELAASWYPGNGFTDGLAVDYYGGDWFATNPPKPLATFAAVDPTLPFGIWEIGNSAGGATYTQTQVTQYIQGLQAFLVGLIGSGRIIDAVMWYQDNNKTPPGPNVISSSTDFRVPLLQALNDAITSTVTSPGLSVAPGATATLIPLAPSPNGGYAPATGLSYDINVNAITSTGSTIPFAKVQLFWHDLDLAGAPSVDRQSFYVPMGATGTAGTNILGRGPQAGIFLALKIQNLDTVTAFFNVQMLSTSRQQTNHKWKWAAGSSVAVPGFTLANGDAFANILCEENPSIGASQTKQFLCSMYTGQIWVRLASSGNFDLVLQEPCSDNAVAYHEDSGSTDIDLLVTSPRSPLLAVVTNNAAGTANCHFELFANE